jgi:hypothetical protein
VSSVGVAYASSSLDSHGGSQSLPQFIDDSDLEAMEWVRTNTEPDAQFVVLGDAAEWFPLFTDRTIEIGPWGVEWKGHAKYQYQLGLYNHISTCDTESCVTRSLVLSGTHVDYLYVPKDTFTVRGMMKTQSPQLKETLLESDRYKLVYENEGVMIFEVKA